MRRRTFLASVAAAACPLVLGTRREPRRTPDDGRTFATPAEARKSPPETLAYVVAVYAGPASASPTTWRRSTSTRSRRPTRRSSTG